ncbi:hypothetical protein BUALT_Bualt07G0013900 [Buddleja alternifolia]|uniref:Uncharacterized protein n=1 Tax=Buddleja alternifolia TaxID=168488 RepID=A0AAV6XHX3_9LAMI|nr:hypothetical protein BUALT_Bualt07G0013900 [Buddleja alternifolia]
MERGGGGGREEHIVMLPFMAQGHLIPFLALANKLINNYSHSFPRLKITIATTPLNARYLRSANNHNNDDIHIHILELPFNSSDHGLPSNTENTEALPLNQMVNLFHSSKSLQPSFQRFIQDAATPPLCIISDVFMGWATEVAQSCSTKNITFTTGGAYGTAAYLSLWKHLPHRRLHSDNNDHDYYFRLPGFPDSYTFHTTQLHHFLRNADGTDSWSKFFQPQIAHSLNSSGWLCNTAEDIEPFGLHALRKITNQLPLWCIGPLLPSNMMVTCRNHSRLIGKHTGREPGVSPEKCLQWLDSHSENSVLYISFGSQNTISPLQMMALAMGLEDSKRAFIWVIRPPVGFDLKGEGVGSIISKEEVKKVIEMVMGTEEEAEEMKRKAYKIGELMRAAVNVNESQKGSSLKAMDDFVAALLSNSQAHA